MYSSTVKPALGQQGQFQCDISENITGTFDVALKWPVCEDGAQENAWNEVALSHNSGATTDEKVASNYHGNADTSGKVCWADHRRNKRPTVDTSCAMTRKRRRTKSEVCLPPELIAMVISRLQEAEQRCALNLIVPDWRICGQDTSGLEESRRVTRILTYTRGDFLQVGSLSCNYGHGDRDHILAPTACFDPKIVALDERFASEYVRALYRNHTYVFTLGLNAVSGEAHEKVLSGNQKKFDLVPLRGQRLRAILPFDDEPADAVKVGAYPDSMAIYEHVRHLAVHSPLELMELHTHPSEILEDAESQYKVEAVDNVLDLDRSAHLWLSWSKMPKLESVYLDLRIYSHDLNTRRRCLSKDEIIKRAEEMSRNLRLRTLILAGLQSYSFYRVYNGETAQEIEQLDTLDGEPNWIKIFRPAVRAGGKIVLVDKVI
ncbi:hypothetical protein GGR55DRAFT_682177 [Xylaria sp. FL0064]|nr:hypothetical protein GGR55DRAFT_682177 [Xylaria sp. FL0064]